ncbi:uncharacterized protein LOC127541375 [Antechinus flavipes]|uniref:uncharacterized protein LOC127541375 n=1 Tax=Antechinus flavipes TaxID=38775 RepID=UPI002235D1C1|nr:uncharacterized protein LOC127541375 [Antechinus flavipes]
MSGWTYPIKRVKRNIYNFGCLSRQQGRAMKNSLLGEEDHGIRSHGRRYGSHVRFAFSGSKVPADSGRSPDIKRAFSLEEGLQQIRTADTQRRLCFVPQDVLLRFGVGGKLSPAEYRRGPREPLRSKECDGWVSLESRPESGGHTVGSSPRASFCSVPQQGWEEGPTVGIFPGPGLSDQLGSAGWGLRSHLYSALPPGRICATGPPRAGCPVPAQRGLLPRPPPLPPGAEWCSHNPGLLGTHTIGSKRPEHLSPEVGQAHARPQPLWGSKLIQEFGTDVRRGCEQKVLPEVSFGGTKGFPEVEAGLSEEDGDLRGEQYNCRFSEEDPGLALERAVLITGARGSCRIRRNPGLGAGPG